ncbi:DUF4253 domain-containing protein [Streptomyces carpaticus]|uniref:DUF4253 domain-containing protein n=1 Tax=Streptomyces carpaticus TaxID=285558 RepID=A0ABV4ZPK2_9ACTN
MIASGEGDGAARPLWLSDTPVSAGLWIRAHAAHSASGLWPLLLDGEDSHDGAFRPWASGELFPERMYSPGAHDPAVLLERWWTAYTRIHDDDHLTPEERLAVTAPFGRTWPRPAPGRENISGAGERAEEYARVFVRQYPRSRLGLVAASGGADALTAVGWQGPANYGDTAAFSAVVHDWERRFGTRVVAVGASTLHLSVAAPPVRIEDALVVAAEHFAFCPDAIWQGARPCTLAAHAERIVGMNCWSFWWD